MTLSRVPNVAAVLLAGSIAAIALFHFPSSAQENAAVLAPKWEYKIVSPSNTPANMEKELNVFGTEGWECVGVYGQVSGGGKVLNSTSAHFILKRAKR
jgi:hypothetical protein